MFRAPGVIYMVLVAMLPKQVCKESPCLENQQSGFTKCIVNKRCWKKGVEMRDDIWVTQCLSMGRWKSWGAKHSLVWCCCQCVVLAPVNAHQCWWSQGFLCKTSPVLSHFSFWYHYLSVPSAFYSNYLKALVLTQRNTRGKLEKILY